MTPSKLLQIRNQNFLPTLKPLPLNERANTKLFIFMALDKTTTTKE